MKPAPALVALLFALGVAASGGRTATAAPADSAASDPRAVAIADRVMKKLGGREHWDALVGLRWTFEVAQNDTVRSIRRHSWNKHTGWHKVSGATRDGSTYLLIHNMNNDEGKAWMGGNPIDGDSLKKLMTRARALWINDSYWFLMPYKLRDPGVILGYEGTTREGDYLFDKISLSFKSVGNTPGDRYWVYVNQASGRVEKWEYVLQETQPPPVAWTWDDWEEHGGLWFATARRGAEGRTIYTRSVETVSAFPASEFTAP